MSPAVAGDLQAQLRGTVLGPGDAGYDDARSIWNGMIDRRPALVARCVGVGDVVSCVNFARELRLPLSIKGGGHNIAGLAVRDEALMIDLSLMRGVWVDPAARVARAQPGCLLGDLDRETQIHGLAAVAGFVSTTGIAGLTLGGGFGYLTRRFGWAGDNVSAFEVVTADGRVVRASDRENPDLFWGLRGGGGNFGVVTGFEYRLHPVGPDIYGGAIAWPADQADAVFAAFQRVFRDAPPELSCVPVVRRAPPAPWLSTMIHGKPIVALFVCYSGSPSDGEKLIAPWRATGSPVGDIIQRRSYLSQQSVLDATQPKGRRYYWKSEYLPALTTDALQNLRDSALRAVSPHSGVLVFPVDGALNRLPADHSPAGNRDATAVVNIMGSWERAADDAANIEWARRAWQDIRPLSTGGTYVNFLTEEEGDDRIRAAYGANYARLVDVKTAWDPENLFSGNKNIRPRVIS
ncbi:MAG TPA: FAD-binding oxidoreductase [Vicinamibacterales bacterium]|nr:FAD-binding oxidoreductase [Vicinamibacterales bacterium]